MLLTSEQSNESTHLSLLESARHGDDRAWRLISEIYRPMILRWAIRHGVPRDDAEDISQDVLVKLTGGLKSFDHAGHEGSFRKWLKTITINTIRDLARLRQRGASHLSVGDEQWLAELADEESELSREWDRQHSEHIISSLLALVELEFAPTTIQIFRRLTIGQEQATIVARDYHTTVGAVYTARSRVLQRIRQVGRELLEEI